MKITKAGTISGCIVWILVFGILSACLLPVAMLIGGFTSVSNFAIRTIGPIICPDGTTPECAAHVRRTLRPPPR